MNTLPRLSAPRPRRLAIAVTALVALGSMTACSGDDDSGDGPDDASSDGTASDEADGGFTGPGEQQLPCRAEVKITGDAQASWMGKAQVFLRGADDEGPGPAARYETSQGKNSLLVLSSGPEDFQPATTVTIGKATYSTTTADGVYEGAAKGKLATVFVQAVDTEGNQVTVESTFTCSQAKSSS